MKDKYLRKIFKVEGTAFEKSLKEDYSWFVRGDREESSMNGTE